MDELDLLRLEPSRFEELCFALLTVELGPGVEWTGGVGDKGRDMVFRGRADLAGETRDGLWVYQAKHHRIPDMTGSRGEREVEKDLETELTKLRDYGTACDHYVLMTNCPAPRISARIAAEVQPRFPEIKTIVVLDGRRLAEWINSPKGEAIRRQFFPAILCDEVADLRQEVRKLPEFRAAQVAAQEFSAEERRSASWLEDARLLLDERDWEGARKKLQGMASQADALPAKLRAKHHNLWGVLHARLGALPDCLREIRTAHGLDPEDSKISGNYFSSLYASQHPLQPKEAQALEKAFKAHPDYPPLLSVWSAHLADAGKAAEALSLLEERLEREPSVPLFLTQAEILHRLGRLAEAHAACAKARLLDPECAEAASLAGALLFEAAFPQKRAEGKAYALRQIVPPQKLGPIRQDLEAAVELYRKQDRLRYSLKTLLNLANVYHLAQDWKALERQAREITDLAPECLQAWMLLSQAFVHLDRPEEAVKALEAARRLEPEDFTAAFNLAAVWYDQKMYQSARVMLGELRGRSLSQERLLSVLSLLATCCLKEGRQPEAEQHLQEVERLAPGSVDALFLRGKFHRIQNHLDAALDCYRRALERDDSRPDLLHAAALLYLDRRQHAEAAKLLARMLELGFRDQRVIELLAACRFNLRLYEDCLSLVDTAMSGAVPSAGLWVFKVLSLSRLGRKAEAARAIEDDSDRFESAIRAQHLLTFAEAHISVGKWEEAIRLLSRAALDPGLKKESANNIAYCRLNMGQVEQAMEAARALIEAPPVREHSRAFIGISMAAGKMEEAQRQIARHHALWPQDPAIRLMKTEEAREVMQRQRERREAVHSLYLNKPMPISFLATGLSRSLFEMWDYLRKSEDRDECVHFCLNGDKSREEARLLASGTPMVLDVSALLTLALLKLLPRLLNGGGTLHIEQRTIDDLDRDFVDHRDAVLADIHDWLHSPHDCLVKALCRLEGEDSFLERGLGRTAASALRLAQGKQLPLYSDDSGTRDLAGQRQIRTVSTRGLLESFEARGLLSHDQKNLALLELMRNNYQVVGFNSELLLWTARRAEFEISPEAEILFDSIRSRWTEAAPYRRVFAESVARIWADCRDKAKRYRWLEKGFVALRAKEPDWHQSVAAYLAECLEVFAAGLPRDIGPLVDGILTLAITNRWNAPRNEDFLAGILRGRPDLLRAVEPHLPAAVLARIDRRPT